MSNRLADELSPYLLQHKDNPVNWYPWGNEALALARQSDKPIFLSIGYAACHWCHVMERESFEDAETAAFMNEHFVNIKVDREERPDIDSVYMNAVQAITGGGGWPLSVWLLPDGRPFYGGTYFPNSPRHGMPSFLQVLNRVIEAFRERRSALERDASNLTQAISRVLQLAGEDATPLSRRILDEAFQQLARQFDQKFGGFGGAPKFPPAMTIELLFRLHHSQGWDHALSMATHTLDRMCSGGIYDHIGGGFHRYSVDGQWLVPHFEKMLYDNALLIRAYTQAYLVTGNSRYRDIAGQTIEYLEREMQSEGGGFYSSQDADSEGKEGEYYVWSEEELRAALSGLDHLNAILDYWGVSRGANFEGKSILWAPDDLDEVAARNHITAETLGSELAQARSLLASLRAQRVEPGLDDKILTSWNGLVISCLAESGRAFGSDHYVQMAVKAANYILSNALVDGRLRRTVRKGRARHDGTLEDYALLIGGLIDLYYATLDSDWFKHAVDLTGLMVELFWDDDAGFYDTSHEHETLVIRPQDVTDGALPSGTSAAVAAMLRLGILADRDDWRRKAERILERLSSAIQSYPSAFSFLACQLDFATSHPMEIAIVGARTDARLVQMLEAVNSRFRPAIVMAFKDVDNESDAIIDAIPLLRHRDAIDGRATAYVCHGYVCKRPSRSVADLTAELDIANKRQV